MLRALTAIICALVLVLGACGGDDDSGSTHPAGQKQSAAAPEKQKQGVCRDVKQPPPRDGGEQKKPSKPLSLSKTYDVDLETTCGRFTIRLDQKNSPALDCQRVVQFTNL